MDVIGLMGLCKYVQGNTIDSVCLSLKTPFVCGILINLRLTKDNIIVLAQEGDLDTFTTSSGQVEDYNYDVLKRVCFKTKIYHMFIPTLEMILECYKSTKILVIDLISNDDRKEDFAKIFAEIIRKYPELNLYIETSDLKLLEYLIKYLEGYRLGYKCNKIPEEDLASLYFYSIDYTFLKREEVLKFLPSKRFIANNVNTKTCFEHLENALGIQLFKDIMLVSDNPKLMRQLEKKFYIQK